MDKTILFFGIIIIFFGILIAYFLLTSAVAFGQTIRSRSTSIPGVKMNEIYFYSFVDIMVVLIGVVIIIEAFKK